MDINYFASDEQDPKVIEKVVHKLSSLLINNENIKYIAVQKKPVANITPDSIVITDKRIIICRPKNLGITMDFIEYFWDKISTCTMKEDFIGATFSIKTKDYIEEIIEFIPKVQVRNLYKYYLEVKETLNIANMDNVQLNDTKFEEEAESISIKEVNNNFSNEDEITQALKKLKSLFDSDLINQEEYELKKSDILSRL